MYLLFHRQGRCCITTQIDIRTIKKDTDATIIMPHTKSFTLANKDYSQRFVHKSHHEQEQLLPDPAWEHPHSIAPEEFMLVQKSTRKPDKGVLNNQNIKVEAEEPLTMALADPSKAKRRRVMKTKKITITAQRF